MPGLRFEIDLMKKKLRRKKYNPNKFAYSLADRVSFSDDVKVLYGFRYRIAIETISAAEELTQEIKQYFVDLLTMSETVTYLSPQFEETEEIQESARSCALAIRDGVNQLRSARRIEKSQTEAMHTVVDYFIAICEAITVKEFKEAVAVAEGNVKRSLCKKG